MWRGRTLADETFVAAVEWSVHAVGNLSGHSRGLVAVDTPAADAADGVAAADADLAEGTHDHGLAAGAAATPGEPAYAWPKTHLLIVGGFLGDDGTASAGPAGAVAVSFDGVDGTEARGRAAATHVHFAASRQPALSAPAAWLGTQKRSAAQCRQFLPIERCCHHLASPHLQQPLAVAEV